MEKDSKINGKKAKESKGFPKGIIDCQKKVKNVSIDFLYKDIMDKNLKIKCLKNQLDDKEDEIEYMNNVIIDKDSKISRLEADIIFKISYVENLKIKLSDQVNICSAFTF